MKVVKPGKVYVGIDESRKQNPASPSNSTASVESAPPNCQGITKDIFDIEELDRDAHNAERKLDVEWLRRSLSEMFIVGARRKVVVATHFAPAYENT